jgi:hypothetical protein
LTGSRKYRFALASLLALVIGGGVAVWRGTNPALFEEYVFGLFLLVAAFGGSNGVEHIAGAVKARREVKP